MFRPDVQRDVAFSGKLLGTIQARNENLRVLQLLMYEVLFAIGKFQTAVGAEMNRILRFVCGSNNRTVTNVWSKLQ